MTEESNPRNWALGLGVGFAIESMEEADLIEYSNAGVLETSGVANGEPGFIG